MDALRRGGELPFDIKDQIIYYCGPSPAPPGKVIGACGPTTSSRMDSVYPEVVVAWFKGYDREGEEISER